MYSILIVDDEAVERDVIRHLLAHYNFPLEICEAANGAGALDLLKQRSFDILLTDVLMPFIDGLTLASEAKKLYPHIQLIFFSGHDDFNYIKTALSLHAINYILKPIRRDEFRQTLSTVIQQMDEQNRQNFEQKITLDITHSHVLYKLINKTSLAQLKQRYPKLDFSFLYRCHRLILIQTEQDYLDTPQNNINIFPLSDELQTLLADQCYFIHLNPVQSLLLFHGYTHPLNWYQELADKLKLHIQNEHHTDCRLVISGSFSAPEDIPLVYQEAEQTLEREFFLSGDSPSDQSIPADLSPENSDKIMEILRTDIQLKDSARLTSHITWLVDSLRNSDRYSQIYCRYLCTNVLKLLLDSFPQDMKKPFDEYARIISTSLQMAPIEALLLNLSGELATTFDQEPNSPQLTVQKIKQYIDHHYHEDLSLEILAKKVYLSPQYLSALFIEHNGYGLSKYIKKVRMEKACRLLTGTNLSVKEISKRVGYSDLSYFCKNFAAAYKLTPDKYRTQHTEPKEGSN